MIFRHLLNMRSHPTWVRGLKPIIVSKIYLQLVSHPTWVRGLKLLLTSQHVLLLLVAPYVGAWIETGLQHSNHP